jgi:hypothetical protein
MKKILLVYIAVFSATLFANFTSRAQDTNFPAGKLAGVAHSISIVGLDDDLPAKLCVLLWPEGGQKQKKLEIKKMSSPAKDEGRVFILRPDNHSIVLMHYTESKNADDTKSRKETYYRTTSQGDLTLALTANFQFTLDELEGEHLKKVTWQTYGQTSGDGSKPRPIDSDMQGKFEAEKKFWLGMEKKLKKMEKKKPE